MAFVHLKGCSLDLCVESIGVLPCQAICVDDDVHRTLLAGSPRLVTSLAFSLDRIQLELVEDKLRELRLLTLDPREYDDKTVTLSQLDRVRQELLATAKGESKYVTFGKVCITHQMQMQ